MVSGIAGNVSIVAGNVSIVNVMSMPLHGFGPVDWT